ncbi:MAG: hypothetical protein JNL67_09690 [Planctomycetaceae bacterium]|nr:hypothetical protein [Planctomycetaceae bacterium]
MKSSSTNPYEPPQVFRSTPQSEHNHSWYRNAFVYGLPLELACSSILVVLLLLIRVPLIHAMIEGQACILALFGSVSVLLLLRFGKHSMPYQVTSAACVIAGCIVMVGWTILAANKARSGIVDEQTTFYSRASGYSLWLLWFPMIACGVFSILLGFTRVRCSFALAFPILLMTVSFATIYILHTTYFNYYPFIRSLELF